MNRRTFVKSIFGILLMALGFKSIESSVTSTGAAISSTSLESPHDTFDFISGGAKTVHDVIYNHNGHIYSDGFEITYLEMDGRRYI